jgi:D-serine deaminase-like pyridoxal phosphate-dependent protein
VATSLVDPDKVAATLLSRVVSLYPHRSPPQALIDAGAIAFSKDHGPVPGYGRVATKGLEGYQVVKISQEHGILEWKESASPAGLEIGKTVQIIPQHACLTTAAHPWYYVVEDGNDVVVDVWVPWKGW